MEIDKTTGLPALPEGYFWRVVPYRETWNGSPTKDLCIMLMLRTKRWWGGYREHIVESGGEIHTHRDENAVVAGAVKIYKEWRHRQQQHMYVGDYPPKNIVGVAWMIEEDNNAG